MTEVVVLLATYQGEKHLREQLDSLLRQTRRPDRILVRDDGSVDGTRRILETYAAAHPGLFEVTQGANLGFVGNFLTLVSATPDEAQIIFFCDQDDVWRPWKIERALERLAGVDARHPALFFTRLEVTGPDLSPTGLSPLHERLDFGRALAENTVTGCTMCANAALIRVMKRTLPDPRKVVAHDWWLFLMASGFGVLLFDPEPSLAYRQHGGNVEGASVGRLKALWDRVRGVWTGKWGRKRPWAMLAHFHALHADLLPAENRTLLEEFALLSRGRSVALAHILRGHVWRASVINRLLLCLLTLFRRAPSEGFHEKES